MVSKGGPEAAAPLLRTRQAPSCSQEPAQGKRLFRHRVSLKDATHRRSPTLKRGGERATADRGAHAAEGKRVRRGPQPPATHAMQPEHRGPLAMSVPHWCNGHTRVHSLPSAGCAGVGGGGQGAFRRHGPARSQHGASACFGAASPLRTRRAAAHQPSKGPASERRLSGVPMPRRGSEYLAHSRRPAPGTFRRHGYGLAGCDHRASACFGAAPPLRTRRAAARHPHRRGEQTTAVGGAHAAV